MASLEQNFPVERKNPSMRRPRDVADLAKPKEAERKKESILVRSWSFPLADLTKQKEAEGKKESIEVAISTGEEESSSGQHVNPGPQNHDASPGTDGSKIEVLELIFFVANFIVELMSIVFDQLSSQHKPFLLPCLIMSISAVLISISELVYKLIKEWDFRKGETNWRSWLFDPPPGAGVRVGFFPCITALTCAFGQFVITTVNYSLYRKDGNAPIKVSISSTIFAFGQLFSSLGSRGAKTETKPKLKPEPVHEPEPVPTSEPEPTHELEPVPVSKPEPTHKPELVPALEPEPEPASKPKIHPEPVHASEPEPELESEPEIKPAFPVDIKRERRRQLPPPKSRRKLMAVVWLMRKLKLKPKPKPKGD